MAGREWLVEDGIGESRAILVENGRTVAARLALPAPLAPGMIADAVLAHRRAGASRGTVRFDDGTEALVDALPRSASEGAPLRVEVTRAAIAEKGRFKRAQTRWTAAPARPAPPLAQALRATGLPVRTVSRFPDDPWPELMAEAMDGLIAFDGGTLIATPTPAMTLIDIDGTPAPRALCLAAVPAIAQALGRLDVAGSIGIDFPTLERKEDRRAIDEALEDALAHWPHQRTAMNGFGFVQLVARLERPSLLHLAQADPAATAARLLLRRAEQVAEPGVLLIAAHPAVLAAVRPEWEAELVRRTGRQLRKEEQRALALGGGFAQALSA